MGYRGKVEERERARELRAQAWTLAEIADELGVSKSSVSVWVRDVEFVPRPARRGQKRGPNRLERRKQAEIDQLLVEGHDRVGRLSERDLLVAGVALYAGEGAKTDGSVRFANTNPYMIGLFCAWLRRFFDIDESRLRGRVYLHEGLDLEEATAYWSHVSAIPPHQFGKPYRAVPNAGIRHTKHRHGCFTVTYSCSRTHREIMGLVNALVSPESWARYRGESHPDHLALFTLEERQGSSLQ